MRRVESLVRTYVAELEASHAVKIGASALILPWLVRHAAFVPTRCIVEADGRSSWARLRGREYSDALAAIGETVDFKLVGAVQGKLEPRRGPGVFLGRRDDSDEIIIGTPGAVEFAGAFRRRALEIRWSREE